MGERIQKDDTEMTLERDLERIIEERTISHSRKEWIETQEESPLPIYNYRLDHVRHVVKISEMLAKHTGANSQVVRLAAWLHDIVKPGIVPVSEHGIESAKVAEEILLSKGIEQDTVNQVMDVIRKHVGLTLKHQLNPIEAQVIWEADKIDKLGIVGFIHFIINGARLQPGMMIEEMAQKVREFLPLAEKIAMSMYTPLGKEMAQSRLEHLRHISFLLDSEIIKHHGEDISHE
ncbi:MAG: HD domain-containing protein [Candidatus Thorarchaeota archaeon]